MKTAKKNRLVTITTGGYITAGSGPSPIPIPNERLLGDRERKGIWREKRALLEQAILNGDFSDEDHLPPIKTLTAAYGVCAATLRKILATLVADGVLTVSKKSHRIAGHPATRYKQSIAVIGERVSPGKLDIYNERTQKLVDTLESSCARSGMSVTFLDYDPGESATERKIRAHLRSRDRILGYVFLVPWGQDPGITSAVSGLIAWLSSHEKPVAILDAMGFFTLSAHAERGHNTQIFRTASQQAGWQVGGYALELGHRRVAYISLLHGYDWSRRRYAGIAHRFAEAGFIKSVVPFTLENIEEVNDRPFVLGSLAPEDDAAIMAIRSPREQLEYLAKFYAQGQDVQERFGEQITAIQKNLSTLMHLEGTDIDEGVFKFIRERAMEDVTSKRNDMLILPLFEAALKDPGITVWITANDGMATSAMRFLKSNGRRVPQDISVIGFDNNPEALEKSLTSYDFNMSGIMHRMLWFIQRYDEQRRQSHAQPPLEVEGMVIERGSTGRAN